MTEQRTEGPDEPCFIWEPNPYRFFPAVLFDEPYCRQRCPTYFLSTELAGLRQVRRSHYLRTDPITGEMWFAQRAIKTLKPIGQKFSEEMKASGLDIHEFKTLKEIVRRNLPLSRWKVPTPKRQLTLDSAKEDAKVFDEVHSGTLPKAGDPFWELAKKRSGYKKTVKRRDLDSFQKSAGLRSKAQDLKARYDRFCIALHYSDSIFYGSSLRLSNEPTISAPPAFRESDQGKVFSNFVAAMGAALQRLAMPPEAYTAKYSQPPPKDAFDELINAHWRRWVEYFRENPA